MHHDAPLAKDEDRQQLEHRTRSNNIIFALPTTPWTYLSGVAVHVGSARGRGAHAHSGLARSARAPPIVFTSGPYSSDIRFDHRTPQSQVLLRLCTCACAPVTRLVAGVLNLLYRAIQHLSLHRFNVSGSKPGRSVAASPFLCGFK